VILGVLYFWPSPWFCVGLYTKSAQRSFSDANLAVKLTAAYNAMRLRLGLVYNSTWLFIWIFACLLGTQRTAQFDCNRSTPAVQAKQPFTLTLRVAALVKTLLLTQRMCERHHWNTLSYSLSRSNAQCKCERLLSLYSRLWSIAIALRSTLSPQKTSKNSDEKSCRVIN